VRVFAAVAELVISASSWTKKAGCNHEQEPFVRPPPLTEGCTFCMTIDFVEDILRLCCVICCDFSFLCDVTWFPLPSAVQFMPFSDR